jgi:hypothetical protein
MVGILSNPFVTVFWAMEQTEIHILGSTPRASDLRILLSCVLNCAFIVACSFLAYYRGYDKALLLIAALSYIASHNVLFSLGIKKPFKVINQKLI